MLDCLVTKLKGVVNNDNLEVLGFGNIYASDTESNQIVIGLDGGGTIEWESGLQVYEDSQKTTLLTSPINFSETTNKTLYFSGEGIIRTSKYSTYSLNNVNTRSILSFKSEPCVLHYIESLSGTVEDLAEFIKGKDSLISVYTLREQIGSKWVQMSGNLSSFKDVKSPNLKILSFGYAQDYSGPDVVGNISDLAGLYMLETLFIMMNPQIANQDIKPLLDGMVSNGRTSGTLSIHATGTGVIYNETSYANPIVTFNNGTYTVVEG